MPAIAQGDRQPNQRVNVPISAVRQAQDVHYESLYEASLPPARDAPTRQTFGHASRLCAFVDIGRCSAHNPSNDEEMIITVDEPDRDLSFD